MTVELEGLAPAAEEGWDTLLFDLNEVDSSSWLLVGGQMMHLLSVEHAAAVVRPTDDVDVVVDVRTRPQGTRWLSAWLQDRGFTLEGSSPDQSATASPGPPPAAPARSSSMYSLPKASAGAPRSSPSHRTARSRSREQSSRCDAPVSSPSG